MPSNKHYARDDPRVRSKDTLRDSRSSSPVFVNGCPRGSERQGWHFDHQKRVPSLPLHCCTWRGRPNRTTNANWHNGQLMWASRHDGMNQGKQAKRALPQGHRMHRECAKCGERGPRVQQGTDAGSRKRNLQACSRSLTQTQTKTTRTTPSLRGRSPGGQQGGGGAEVDGSGGDAVEKDTLPSRPPNAPPAV